MSDSDKLKPETLPTEPSEAEDEPIIDLVEEIEEQRPLESLSPIDQSLPEIREASPSAGAPSTEFAELGKMDFDKEEDQPEDDGLSLGPATGESDALDLEEDMDWLLDPEEQPLSEAQASSIAGDHPPDTSSADASLVSREVNETSPETEAILEAMTPPSTETDSGNEEDDLELIEIEDDEFDDELVWFDDLDLEPATPSAGLTSEEAPPAQPRSDTDADLFPETSAADVFAANVASGSTTADNAPAVFSSAAALLSAAASPTSAPPIHPPTSDGPPVAASVSLSTEQIEAAVERVIERKLGGTLESIVLRAVETAVANEIQRLKTLLLDDDFYDRTP